MQKFFLCIAIIILCDFPANSQTNSYTVELARTFSKDLFEENGVNYLKPMVEAVNATSNSRFFNQAYIPTETEKPYFRIGLHSMFGFVPDDMKSYKPIVPTQEYSLSAATDFMSIDLINRRVVIKDTAGLIRFFFLTILDDGMKRNSFGIPTSSPTILGSKKKEKLIMEKDTLRALVNEHPIFKEPLWALLPPETRDSLQNSLKQAVTPVIDTFPGSFTLPEGGEINMILAAIPQIEIGSFLGTEALIRFIPPVNLGENIGDFAFWGFGLKHSISQYFGERYFDLAIQGAYQGTNLKNKVGVTNSKLNANAAIWNLNIHASKSFENLFDIFTGFSYEAINISSSFIYYLPVELQWELGLLEPYSFVPTPGYPGDQHPQTVSISISDRNLKWTAGIAKQIGNFAIFADFSISRLLIVSGGIEYRF